MRLPDLDVDGWEVSSGEEWHREYPDTFSIPPLEERRGLQRGQAAHLIFDILTQEEDGSPIIQGERMNVIVTERIEGEGGDLTYIGILDDAPVSTSEGSYLRFGAEVPFRPEHVIGVADPPAEYVEWQLGQPPEGRWPRD